MHDAQPEQWTDLQARFGGNLLKWSCVFCNSLKNKEDLVGTVGGENTLDRSLKELQEMRGSSKPLKRNNGEHEGILIGPSFFSTTEIPSSYISRKRQGPQSNSALNLAARMASRRPKLQQETRYMGA